MSSYWSSETFGLQKDEHDHPVAAEVDEPEHKENNAKQMVDERVDRRKLGPVLVHQVPDILGQASHLIDT